MGIRDILIAPPRNLERMRKRLASPARDASSTTEEDGDDGALIELNNNLSVLAIVFPRILPEVFREMLQTFEGDSRLQIVVEQLLKHQDQWVRGRWRVDIAEITLRASVPGIGQPLVTAEDKFRRASYKWASRTMLYEEFKVLSRSKIEAVLAEENFCYSRARPTLQSLASKTWRSTVGALISRWTKPARSASKDHYMMVGPTTQGEEPVTTPVLRETGDIELDLELHRSVLKPYLERVRVYREAKDWAAAVAINEAEAKYSGAIYECECCYSDTTFEQMASCTTGGHVICFQCIWHTVSEALFGQNWERSMDHACGQVKCIAPMAKESCDGYISQSIVRRAILQSTGGKEALTKLDSRLADEAIRESRLPLVLCPFCAYAEVDELYFPPSTIRYTLNITRPRSTFVLLVVMLFSLPLLFVYSLTSHLPPFQALPHLTSMFSESLASLSRARHLARRFQCCSSQCGLPSCRTCLKIWQDPHICHESATLSLRTTIEAARTAALKRTCPRCRLGFIKDSGCNKLTCVCGYSMCYICRQGLGRVDGGEGYRHFCQHFRAAGGACKECDRCDLYKIEDDEGVVRKAGALAEKQWREKEGMIGVGGIGGGQEAASKKPSWEKLGTMQGLLDWWVGEVLTC